MPTRRAILLTLCAMVTLTARAPAAIFEWVPVDPSGTFNAQTGRWEVILPNGGGVTVTLKLRLSGWDPGMDGDPLLGAFQAMMDEAGLLGTNAQPRRPGVDLLPLGWPDAPEFGAFQAIDVCFGGTLDGQPCSKTLGGPFYTPAECSNAGGQNFCAPNTNFVLYLLDPIASVSTPSLNAYSWGAAIGVNAASGKADMGDTYYGGTLILDVPADASSAYTIGFNTNPDLTFMNDDSAGAISSPLLIAATISVEGGPCCDTLADFALFQNCFTGFDIELIPTDCRRFDFNNDNQIDWDDLITFEQLLTGP